MDVKRVGVLEAGLMGHGIAQVLAQAAKLHVTIRYRYQPFIDKGMNVPSIAQVRSRYYKFKRF